MINFNIKIERSSSIIKLNRLHFQKDMYYKLFEMLKKKDKKHFANDLCKETRSWQKLMKPRSNKLTR